jgi:LPXTG-motif cell wall-anchored protein
VAVESAGRHLPTTGSNSSDLFIGALVMLFTGATMSGLGRRRQRAAGDDEPTNS